MLLEQDDIDDEPKDRVSQIRDLLDTFHDNLEANSESIDGLIQEQLDTVARKFDAMVRSSGGLDIRSWASNQDVVNAAKYISVALVKSSLDTIVDASPELFNHLQRALIRAFFHLFMGVFRTLPSELIVGVLYDEAHSDDQLLLFTSGDDRFTSAGGYSAVEPEALAYSITGAHSRNNLTDLHISINPNHPGAKYESVVPIASSTLSYRLNYWWGGRPGVDGDIKKSMAVDAALSGDFNTNIGGVLYNEYN